MALTRPCSRASRRASEDDDQGWAPPVSDAKEEASAVHYNGHTIVAVQLEMDGPD